MPKRPGSPVDHVTWNDHPRIMRVRRQCERELWPHPSLCADEDRPSTFMYILED